MSRFRFPESVKIAVFINGSKRFSVSEEELSLRLIFVSEIAAVRTEICLDQDPLDLSCFSIIGCSTEPTFTETLFPFTSKAGTCFS